MEYNKKDVKKETEEQCRLLFESKIPWETGHGWYDAIRKFSLKCEELNLRFHRKYRLRIIAEQIKEKYGDIRLYCHVSCDPCIFLSFVKNIMSKVMDAIDKIDFKFVTVWDTHSRTERVIRIFESEDDMKKSGLTNCTNVKTAKLGGKPATISNYSIFGKRHYEATAHKFIFKIRKAILKMTNWIETTAYDTKKSDKRTVIRDYMDMMLDRFVDETEKEASHTCENCGTNIDEKYHKACWTTGWMTLLCESCAKKDGRRYSMDGKIYERGVYVKDEDNRYDNR